MFFIPFLAEIQEFYSVLLLLLTLVGRVRGTSLATPLPYLLERSVALGLDFLLVAKVLKTFKERSSGNPQTQIPGWTESGNKVIVALVFTSPRPLSCKPLCTSSHLEATVHLGEALNLFVCLFVFEHPLLVHSAGSYLVPVVCQPEYQRLETLWWTRQTQPLSPGNFPA